MGYQCTAFDDLEDNWHRVAGNRERILDFARRFGISFQEEFAPESAGDFDMVILNDVLEHLHESPRPLLTRLVSALKPEGLLFVTVPNLVNLRKRLAVIRGRTNLPPFDLYFSYDGFWRGPVREYVRHDLEELARRMQLTKIELRTTHHMLKNLRSFPARMAYRAVTRAIPDLADTWILVARRPKDWRPGAVDASTTR
jgi:SAM-dependent methyltransferase